MLEICLYVCDAVMCQSQCGFAIDLKHLIERHFEPCYCQRNRNWLIRFIKNHEIRYVLSPEICNEKFRMEYQKTAHRIRKWRSIEIDVEQKNY